MGVVSPKGDLSEELEQSTIKIQANGLTFYSEWPSVSRIGRPASHHAMVGSEDRGQSYSGCIHDPNENIGPV